MWLPIKEVFPFRRLWDTQPQLLGRGFPATAQITCHRRIMPNRIRLVLALHNHQPIGNFDHVFQQAFDDSYRNFLDVFSRYPIAEDVAARQRVADGMARRRTSPSTSTGWPSWSSRGGSRFSAGRISSRSWR